VDIDRFRRKYGKQRKRKWMSEIDFSSIYTKEYRDKMDVGRNPELVPKLFHMLDLREKHVLDVGCSSGYWVTHLNRLGARARGIDVSPFTNQIRADACHIPFKDGAFDWVISISTTEHILPDKQDVYWREMLRVSRIGVSSTHLVGAQDWGIPPADSDKSHCCVFTKDWWMKRLAQFDKEHSLLFDDFFLDKSQPTFILLRRNP
jgi:SAM-dependent methyltransferase